MRRSGGWLVATTLGCLVVLDEAGYTAPDPRIREARPSAAPFVAAPAAVNDGPAPTGGAATTPRPGPMTFAERCAHRGVVRCFGFDSEESVRPYIAAATQPPFAKPTVDVAVKSSGTGSLKFTVPSLSGPNTSGLFAMNFTPGSLNHSRTEPYPVQFGEGQEFYVQWRQRFSPEFLTTRWAGGGGWKQIVIGEGDRRNVRVSSCTQLEVVVGNYLYRGFPRMYHSCGGKDGQYQGLYEHVSQPGRTTPEIRLQNLIAGCIYRNETVPPCVGYKPDEWMTFQVHVKIGTWYRNDKNYHRDSVVELWVAEEGKPSVAVIRLADYDLANTNPDARYGKLWLTPYNTGKDKTVDAPESYTWYDDLIISQSRIPDPS